MGRLKHDTCHMHDKSRGMVREKSRERFMEEKKEMEKERSDHRETVVKLMNDDYAYLSTSRYRRQYVVKFQHPESHKIEKLTFHYEPNLKQLEAMWQQEETH